MCCQWNVLAGYGTGTAVVLETGNSIPALIFNQSTHATYSACGTCKITTITYPQRLSTKFSFTSSIIYIHLNNIYIKESHSNQVHQHHFHKQDFKSPHPDTIHSSYSIDQIWGLVAYALHSPLSYLTETKLQPLSPSTIRRQPPPSAHSPADSRASPPVHRPVTSPVGR